MFWANTFLTTKASDITRAPSYSSRQSTSKQCMMNLTCQGTILLQVDVTWWPISRSCCILVDAPWRDKHNETTSIALCSLWVISKTKVMMTSYECRRPNHEVYRPKFVPGSTMVYYKAIQGKLSVSDACRRKMNFLQLPHNGEVTKLT